jgi:hypothetical protein
MKIAPVNGAASIYIAGASGKGDKEGLLCPLELSIQGTRQELLLSLLHRLVIGI